MKLLQILLICAALAAGSATSDLAAQIFKAGEKAEKAGDNLHAYLLYARAAALEPSNIVYLARRTALQSITALSAREELGPDPAALGETPTVNPPDPRDLMEAREAAAPPRLKASPEKKSFDLRGDPRSVIEKVGQAYGIQMVFEADYQAPPPFRFEMTEVGYEDALRALEAVSNSFFVPVNPHLALVVRDTPQKRTERMPAMAVAIPIPERMSVQDAQEMITAVQQTLEIRRVNFDATRHVVIVRDLAPKVEAAQALFANLSRIRPQIEVDVQLVSVDKNSSLSYGINPPNQFVLQDVGSFLGNVPVIPSAVNGIARLFGGGATIFALGANQAAIFAAVSKSTAINLFDAQIVTLDGQQATLHIGSRYPIITNGYYGNATGSGTVYAPPPTINFEDLGLVLKVTPAIHGDDDVTLDVDVEYKLIAGNSGISGIPIIGSQTFTGKVRVRNGDWGVVAGLIQMNFSDDRSGMIGLASIPILGHLFSQTTVTRDSSQVLIVLKPHLTALPAWDYVPTPVWVGTETRPISLF